MVLYKLLYAINQRDFNLHIDDLFLHDTLACFQFLIMGSEDTTVPGIIDKAKAPLHKLQAAAMQLLFHGQSRKKNLHLNLLHISYQHDGIYNHLSFQFHVIADA